MWQAFCSGLQHAVEDDDFITLPEGANWLAESMHGRVMYRRKEYEELSKLIWGRRHAMHPGVTVLGGRSAWQ